MKKQLVILIGLKGSGKTYIGSLIQSKLNIIFFRVEDVWLSLKSERLSRVYILEGFGLIEKKIDEMFLNTEQLIIESTGTTDYFEKFINKLRKKYDLKLVKVHTNPDLCLKRVRSRDSSMHVPVSDDIVKKINEDALKVNLNYDLIIDNEKSSDIEILDKIQKLLISTMHNRPNR